MRADMISGTGKIFVLEGPDDVGKTTLATGVTNKLKNAQKCVYLSFPGNEPGTIGSLVYDIHHNKQKYGLKSIDATSLQTLHIAAHINCISNVIIPLFNEGYTLILDRYWWSTKIYGGLYGCDNAVIDKLIDVEKLIWGSIEPSIIFYIERGFHRNEISTEQDFLAKKYSELAKQENYNVPIVKIINKSVNESIDHIIWKINKYDNNHHKSLTQDKLLPKKQIYKSTQYPTSPLVNLLNPTVVYDTYWEFAAKRQEIFFSRLYGNKSPWTDDFILQNHKFTNAYRASDRVSQYLIKNVIYSGCQDVNEVFFRIILFKIFNKIETWETLIKEFGKIKYSDFNLKEYDKLLTKQIESNHKIYSAAYIMPTGGRGTKYDRKHRMHLDLITKMMQDELPLKIATSKSMGKVFELLRSYSSIGDFLAYQYATDINYSAITDFSETQFVVPGPGAKDGIQKCFAKTGGLTEAEIIKVVMEHQEEEFSRLGLNFKTLWGRPLQLIDCQNLFCETDKYARIKHPEFKGKTGRSRIKQKFQPNPKPIEYWYPPKWGINDKIQLGEYP